ncbi:helix-turn-helix domain-containing protein [Natrononativus amylolyticus]|uniref:helix-turn-helix domain-containing protein n=1 Tax=Natrononativus amylolyticus TaxID=2963434 RepID=UPI0020CFB7AB|nr:helix-turn-helix domain-containing protein [Natrononativus amylolyticus]
MSLLAEYEVAAPSLFLTPTLEAVPGLEVEIERQFALVSSQPVAFCWLRYGSVGSGDREALERAEAALEADATVEGFERVEDVDRRALYRVRRSESDVLETYEQWMAVGAELLRCRGSGGRWEVEMRFPDREAFTAYYSFLEAAGVAFDLQRLSDGAEAATDDILTESQREAVCLAWERGFFDVPRETTLEELAVALDISDQAVSERLRRGQSRLVEEYLS